MNSIVNSIVNSKVNKNWPFPQHPMPVPAKAPPVKFNPDNLEDAPW